MIKEILLYKQQRTNPYENLALEAYFLQGCPEDTMLFYLWKNSPTVVIGKNQNAWQECNIDAMEEDGVFLARRPSGGGAVYHDLGNQNFTFITRQKDHDIKKQLQVICDAVGYFGLLAEQTGRNDIVIGGRKFSGNAFQNAFGSSCHHGTLLVDTSSENMAKYLNVSQKKIKSKGVSSVRSRVVNLKELSPEITTERLCEKLIESLQKEYGCMVKELDPDFIDREECEKMAATFSSWQWRLGEKKPFTYEISERFSWGEVTLDFLVQDGFVNDIYVYSDSMSTRFVDLLPSKLRGNAFSFSVLADALSPLAENEEYREMTHDLQALLRSQKGES